MEKTFRIIFLNTLLTILFLLPKTTFAISAPNPSSPFDGSTVTSGLTLTWEAVSDSIQYKIIVDDEPSITSPYAKGPYYTTNTKYSPQLNSGTFYWKVAAKDATGSWSDWSSNWSFTLSTTNPSPTSAQSESSYSTPYSAPTTSDSNPTPTPSSKSSFIISDIPPTIDSDKSFTVSVELNLPNSPSTIFYLKGAFKKADSSNYFGFTKFGSSWVKNGSSYSSQNKITTDSAGAWSGILEVKPDDTDSGFSGSGDYIFKVGRYSLSGSGPTWSNEETININEISYSEDSTETQGSKISDVLSDSVIPTSFKNSSKILSPRSKIPAVAGVSIEATPSSTSSATEHKEEIAENKNFNFIPIIGGVMILLGLGSLIYIYLKQKLQSS